MQSIDTESRLTAALARHRNGIVAALADEVCFARITPGGEMDRLSKRAAVWQLPAAPSNM